MGALNSFSAFPFKSMLGNMSRKIRSTNNPLAQLSRRISEGYTSSKTSKTYSESVYIDGCRLIPGDLKNSCVMLTDGTFGIVTEVSHNIAKVTLLRVLKPAAIYPCNSSFLNMFIASLNLNGSSSRFSLSKIKKKCILLPWKNNFFCLPSSLTYILC